MSNISLILIRGYSNIDEGTSQPLPRHREANEVLTKKSTKFHMTPQIQASILE